MGVNRKKRTGLLIILALVLLCGAVLLARLVGRELEKRTYRLLYPELVSACSVQYGLDPYLVAAVIHTESGNRKDVVSKSGACGLMQIMPETGEWIAGKLLTEAYDAQRLFEPALNVEYGCWYLRFLLDRYEQDVPLALAAYNAGQGTVDKWLQDPVVSKDNILIAIPYPETDRYIEKVHHAYEKYQTLYPNSF